MQIHKSYQASLIESLKDPREAAAYLDAVFEDGDVDLISLALKDVAEAQRNVLAGEFSSSADWEKCYQLLSKSQLPELPTLISLLSKLGLKLRVTKAVEQVA